MEQQNKTPQEIWAEQTSETGGLIKSSFTPTDVKSSVIPYNKFLELYKDELIPGTSPIVDNYQADFLKYAYCQKQNALSPGVTCNTTCFWTCLNYLYPDIMKNNSLLKALEPLLAKRQDYKADGTNVCKKSVKLQPPDLLKAYYTTQTWDRISGNNAGLSVVANRLLNGVNSDFMEEKWVKYVPQAGIGAIIQNVVSGIPVVISCRPYAYAINSTHKVILVGVSWFKNGDDGINERMPNYFHFYDPYGSFISNNWQKQILSIPAWLFYQRFGVKVENNWRKTCHFFMEIQNKARLRRIDYTLSEKNLPFGQMGVVTETATPRARNRYYISQELSARQNNVKNTNYLKAIGYLT